MFMYRVGKLLEKKEQEADTLMQIGDVLRKHDNDLEKQVQELHREKQELDREKEILQEQWGTIPFNLRCFMYLIM